MVILELNVRFASFPKTRNASKVSEKRASEDQLSVNVWSRRGTEKVAELIQNNRTQATGNCQEKEVS